MIIRSLESKIQERLFSGKAILVNGPRQSGKTTIIKKILKPFSEEALILDGDDPAVQNILNRPNTEQIKNIIGKSKILFIDEAQRIPEIGLTAKIIIDQLQPVQLILSGSSAFDLSRQFGETLTGRKWTFTLYPVSWQEWQDDAGYLKSEQDLENRLVFGFYPDVLNHPSEPTAILRELADSYLYKDVLMYGNIKKPEVVQKLLQALAFQVGNEVSYRELGETTNIDPKTVSLYIDILEKAYVVFRLPAFSRNLRNEIKANRKVYFFDNGVRNAVTGHFQPLANRQDVGALWENFLVSERLKCLHYFKIEANPYFWRTKQQQEVDYVEERNGQVYGYEFKWNNRREIRFPKTFSESYHSINFGVNRNNFRDFIIQKDSD